MSRSLGGTSLTTRSPMRRVPSEISSSPAIIRRLVVFPQPDGPTRTMNSPSPWAHSYVPSAHRGPLHPAAEAERGRAPYVAARVAASYGPRLRGATHER